MAAFATWAESKLHLFEARASEAPASASAATDTHDTRNGRALAPAEAIDYLSSLPEDCSPGLGPWRMLARFVLDLLAARQFLPVLIEKGGDRCEAAWRPLIHGRPAIAWLERVAAGLDEGSGSDQAQSMVEDFLNTTLDGYIRRCLVGDPFFDNVRKRAAADAPAEIRWLGALLGPDREVPGGGEANAELAAQVRGWLSALEARDAPESLRLCFELLEPDEHDWQVALSAESAREPGRTWDVGELLRETPAGGSIFSRRRISRREQLLAELDRAAGLFPLLRAAQMPDGAVVPLSIWEARNFIREWGPALEARGFKVSLPLWARPQRPRLGLKMVLRPRVAQNSASLSTGSLGLDSVVEFDWRIAVGDQEVDAAEFERLATQGVPLVRHGDTWLEWDAEAAGQMLELVREQGPRELTLRDALRTAYGADEESELPIVGLAGASWVDTLLRGAPEGGVQALEQPGALRGQLRPYQRRGLDWLAFLDARGIGACLADDMGLGKTVQLIALLLHERETRRSPPLPLSPSPTLLFAPASVVGNWERELQRFAPGLRVLVHHGPQRLEGEAFQNAAQEHDVVITTYALGHRDFDELRRVNWGRVVLDEAQKIKNPAASQTAAIRSIRAARRVALTGTPIENHLPELWSIMEVLNPGLLGSAAQFRKRFVGPIEKQRDPHRAAQLRQLLAPFILRRVKTDPGVICDLPEKMEMRVYCNLTVEQAARYRQVVDDSLAAIDSSSGIRRRGLILAMLTRLKQVCNHPSLILRDGGPLHDRSGKCERLVEMLEEVLDEGDAALVFTQYRKMGHLLEELLAQRLGIETLFLHGGTPTKQRDRMIERFQDPEGGIRVFLLSLKAGGLGINLTAANHVFHFDRWWNPAVESQATDRTHRVGQTRRVQVHKFVCIGTVEERIDKLLEEKRALAEGIIRSGDDWLTGLSTTELRDVIMLSQEAVG